MPFAIASTTASLLVLLLGGCPGPDQEDRPSDRIHDTGPLDADGDGWTVAGGDCDDSDAAVNPGADEICHDGIDNDCDGTADTTGISGTVDLSLADAKLVGRNDEDYAGCSLAVGDLDDDGIGDVVVGARAFDGGGSDAGSAGVFRGPACGVIDLPNADAVLLGEEDGDWAGSALAVGDVDGDGIEDLVVGAELQDGGSTHGGAAYIVRGPLAGTMNLSQADAKLVGAAYGARVGGAVAAGDVNGDGIDDLVAGAWGVGVVYLVTGPVAGTIDATLVDATLVGDDADVAGCSVAAGDVDGDGIEDVLVGALTEDTAGTRAGAVYLVYGPVSGTVDLSAADATFLGENEGDAAGIDIALGDIDGDGASNVLIGAYEEGAGGDEAGAAYVLAGPLSGTTSLSQAEAKLTGEHPGDEAGYSIASGDVDGDGMGDILVGARREESGGEGAGVAYLVLGPVGGTSSLSLAAAKLAGEQAFDVAGTAVAAGDVDGDGIEDALVGADGKYAGSTFPGAAYLLYGGGS